MNILRKQDGFTLIEALTAMVILTIGILSFFTLHGISIWSNSRANAMSTATALVSNQIETLRQTSYATLVSSIPATEVVDAQTQYRVTWTVAEGIPVADAKTIVVTCAVPNSGPTVSFDYVRHNDGT